MLPVPNNKFNCDSMIRTTEFLPKNRVVGLFTAVCRQKFTPEVPGTTVRHL